jgi:hypothetical protein
MMVALAIAFFDRLACAIAPIVCRAAAPTRIYRMDALDLVIANLATPIVLSFALGVIAVAVRSDLEIPEEIYSILSTYLLLAIGLKGGVGLAGASLASIALPLACTLALGLAIPVWSCAVLRAAGRFSVEDAAAIAAHYGSVSVVTFIAATGFVEKSGAPADDFMPTLVAALEVPGIIVALLLARRSGSLDIPIARALGEILAGRSILLLLGGVAMGAIRGARGLAGVAPFFVEPFKGALCLFLLELGIVTGKRLGDLRRVGTFLLLFGVAAPLGHGALGVWLGSLAGLGLGGAAVLGAMAASASYMAAPAAVRLAIPAANPACYLTAAIGITFPFNLAIGIPIYFALAPWIYA